jgi:2-polyprenyl-6-methoxyphenol hydroxylase-like FAD-dependent oxidoreductase
MPPDVPVAIAGAGPVGLALALGLARLGVRSVILEKAPGLPPHARAGGIWPRTLEILHGWQALDAIKREGVVQPTLAFTDANSGTTLVRLDFRPLAAETLEPFPVFIPQDRTEALLLAALEPTGMCDVRFNHPVVGLTQDSDGVDVRVLGDDGAETSLRAAYVVGADGGQSAVRAALGLKLDGETYPMRAMLADVLIDDARNDLPWPRASFKGEFGFAIAIRFGKGLWRLIHPVAPTETDEAATAPELIAELVRVLLGPGPFKTDWVSTFNIHRRLAREFTVGRVMLAGDAAHLNSPAGGQGMNFGIGDAQNLAWKLAAALDGADGAALMRSYDVERRSMFVANVEKNTDRITRLVILTPTKVRPYILRIVGLLTRLPVLRGKLRRTAAMINLRYRTSPLISGSGPFLGARAPDPVLACGGPATLVFAGMPKAIVDAAAAVLKLPARTLEAADAKRWRMRGPFGALVRPDGHVGWMAGQPSADEIDRGVRQALAMR